MNYLAMNVLEVRLSDFEHHSLVARIFEHSVQDGLRLAEKLRYTEKDYFAILDRSQFYLKHLELAGRVMNLVRGDIKDNDE